MTFSTIDYTEKNKIYGIKKLCDEIVSFSYILILCYRDLGLTRKTACYVSAHIIEKEKIH